ncbi:MAG TPA: YqhA family protein [Salinibacter sp.]|nr:YqhA family protein [Salinibacter sp.]
MNRLEKLLEQTLWQSRFLLSVAVIASTALWLIMLYITTVDVVFLFDLLANYASPSLSVEDRTALRLSIIQNIVGVVDGYLITAALFIFSLGFYEVFVSQIDIKEKTYLTNTLFEINTFDGIKNLLARMIMLILMVKLLQQALRLKYNEPLDLLYLGLGVLFVGAGIYLGHLSHKHASADSPA